MLSASNQVIPPELARHEASKFKPGKPCHPPPVSMLTACDVCIDGSIVKWVEWMCVMIHIGSVLALELWER